MQDAKEEVRSRLNIEDVIGEYVQLKRAGRNYKGLSPFSGEKTPSFYVSPDKNIWHDFSSNKGGDIFTFVMEVEGMDFRQALEHLARKAGVELMEYESPDAKRRAFLKKRAIEANELAARYYQQNLLRNQHALEYVFKKRKLSKQVVQDFQIGYAPDNGSALTNFLLKRGFSRQEISDAGLANRYGGDMFRGRMMVPLMDPSGQVIGFTGRIIGDVPNAPKYLNTPQTLVYDKGRHIFALSQAKEAIRKHGYAVVVEGNLDVVSSHQVGVSQVVATAGTAMTDNHIKALKRLTGDIRLAYDGDKAGIAAAERAIEIAAQVNIDLTIVTLPKDVKDPDELIKQDSKKWRWAVEHATPAIEWVLDQYAEREDLNSARGKQQYISIAYKLLAGIEDRATVRHYGEIIANRVGFSYEDVLSMVERNDVEERIVLTEDEPAVFERKHYEEMEYRYEDDVLAVAAVDGASQELFAHVDVERFHGVERQALARYYAAQGGRMLSDTPDELQKYDTYVKIVLLRADERYIKLSSDERYYETARLLRQIEHEHRKQMQADLVNELRNAERTGNEEGALLLREQLNNLIKEIARGKR